MTYNITALHAGASDPQVRVGKLQIYTVIPNKDVAGGGYANLTVDTASRKVYYKNSTGTYELTVDGTNVKAPIVQSTATANGTIIMDIADLSTATISGGGAIGQNLSRGGASGRG